MGTMRSVKTTCPYCGVGCGIVANVANNGDVDINGDKQHPANFGRLCSKGISLAETLAADTRLLHPQIDGKDVSREQATTEVAQRFTQTIAQHGADSVAFYVSGQLLTEDYYVANKLMKGFIGSANIDTNSRLCMASSVAGHRRAFGADTVPGSYSDLELADLVILVGSNLAWCHPVLYQRLAAAREARPQMKVVLIDPRRTVSAEIADLHLAIHADGDVALFNALLAWLASHGGIDEQYVADHTNGLQQALAAASGMCLSDVAQQTGIDTSSLIEFFQLVTKTKRTVTVYSQGVNQSASGTDKVNAIINVHLASGRIGRPGMGPFSVTGQPNAMGGREVGGLANTLAAHMDLEDSAARDRVQRFWQAPLIAEHSGLKAVQLFEELAHGKIKALWIMATNPVDSLPQSLQVEAALAQCPFVVVSDIYANTDTVRHAHVRLPATGWGEKDGTVTNSERRISRQRAFLPAPGKARADWWIICEVARRMGFANAFQYDSAAAIFDEHAALSAYENSGSRDFNLAGLVGLDAQAYEQLTPLQWPVLHRPPAPSSTPTADSRFFANGSFFTADRKARFVPVCAPTRARADKQFAMTLNTGRVRDHWHTMTRTGRSARLSAHMAEPFAELHPRDAQRLAIDDAQIVRVANDLGSVLLRARITTRQREGNVFAPMHWSEQFAAAARVNILVPPLTDPVSGQPASKNVAVRVEPLNVAHYVFAVLRERPATPVLAQLAPYWAIAICRQGWRLELALTDEIANWESFAQRLFAAPSALELLASHDKRLGNHRVAAFSGSQLVGALFSAPCP